MTNDRTSQQSSIYLPGYEAQLHDDGVHHSKCKVEQSADELSSSCMLDREIIFTLPCKDENETLTYRCNCTFQIVRDEKNGLLCYAMRQNKQACVIGADYFPIANTRIQNVMRLVLQSFNHREGYIKQDCKESKKIPFDLLQANISSVSFASSWNQNLDCIVTFNYDKPIVDNDFGYERELLMEQATTLSSKCNITALILRSRKVKIIAGWNNQSKLPCIRDKICLSIPQRLDSSINVTLDEPNESFSMNEYHSVVYYEKPQDAFQHPNQNAMIHALKWMLTKLRAIAYEYRQQCKIISDMPSFNILEMYNGCGAHTLPIAKSSLFDAIVTVELDNRLVEACKVNAELNNFIVHNDEKCINENLPTEEKERKTQIHIFQGDAGEFSKKILKHQNQNKNSLFNKEYNVLLLDPPRAGLDSKVCHLAKSGTFEHIIYISCGREALKGDLVKLNDTFKVIDCTIIDLFPRTDSVESLVHLKRIT